MSAVGYAATGDTRKVNKAGDTMTGPLVLGDGAGPTTSLTLLSSFDGGEDEGEPGQYDSTSRINLESYQRADEHTYGEIIRIFSRRFDSKQMIAWYGPTSYDTNGDPVGINVPWFWMGAHYEANDHASVHGHWSVETPDASGSLQTRFELTIWDPLTGQYGMNKAMIKTNLADFVVRTSNGQELRISSPAGNEKPITFSNDSNGASVSRRWKIRVTSDAESGGNAGSDMQILRYDDTGTTIDQPIIINRATGLVSIGGTSGTAGGLAVTRIGSPAVTITALATGGTALLAQGADAASRFAQAQVSADAASRLVIYVDGKHEWGDGTASRDTNLYRSAADTLKTDDSLHVAGRLGVSAAPHATIKVDVAGSVSSTLVRLTRTSTSDASPLLLLLGGEAASPNLVLSVNGDAANRFAIEATGIHTWGDGTASRDTNLYRSAADTLKTDDSLHVATRAGIGTAPDTAIRIDVANSAAGTLARFTRTSTSDTSPVLLINGGEATSATLVTTVNGDASNRYAVRASGLTEWGSGSATRDTNLYRNAADQLKTDDSLVVGTRFTVGAALNAAQLYSQSDGSIAAGTFTASADGTATQAVLAVFASTTAKRAVDIRVTGDAVSRLRIDTSAGTGSGTLTFGNGTLADTNLYRGAADLLATDDSVTVGTRLTVGSATLNSAKLYVEDGTATSGVLFKATVAGTTTIGVVRVESSDNTKRLLDLRVTGDGVARLKVDMSAGSGSGTLTFGNGTTADVNLYRSATTTLKTDNSFHVGAALSHLGSTLGFYGTAPAVKPTVTGSRGSNDALASLLTALAGLGLLTDSST